MAGLQGLQSLQQQTVEPVSTADILAQQGTTTDPEHGQAPYRGANPNLAGPYPSQGNQNYGPTGLEDPYTGNWALGCGSEDPDQSPISHAAPFPSPGHGQLRNADEEWAAQQAGMDAHAADFGTPKIVQSAPFGQDYVNATFDQTYTESPGTTVTEGMHVPMTILSGGGGGRDRNVLGNGGNPTFDVAHIQRREQVDGIPYNYQWLDATQRPMTVRQVGLTATFDGPDSPYGAQGDTTQNMMLGPDQAAVMSDATEYVPPPAPTVAPSYATASDSWAW